MDITTINTVWSPVYNRLMRGIQQLTPEYAKLRQLRNFSQLSPRSINWAVELVNGGGIAFSSDGGSTARASSNEPPEATDTWTFLVGRFEIGYDALNPSGMSASVIEPQLRYQAADKLRSYQRAVAIGFYGYPDAILFSAEGTVSNPSGNQTKVRVNDLYGIVGITFDRIRDYMTVNKDYVNVKTGTTSATRGGGKLLAIDETNDDITLDSASYFGASVVDGDAIVLNNQVLAGSVDDLDLGLNGLLHLTRATTVHGIATSAQPDWAASVDVSSYGASLGGKDTFKWFETVEQRSGHRPDFGYTTIEAIAAAGGGELDQRRYGANAGTMRIGFRELDAMGVMLDGRPYCPNGHFFFGSGLRKIAPDEDPKNVVSPGDKSGGFKQYENQLGFYKDQALRTQIACTSRLALGVVSGVTEA